MDKKLIEQLKEIKADKFKFDEELDKPKLAKILVENIGNHDSFVRDGLVYPTLANLLYYDHEQKQFQMQQKST